MEIKRPNPDRLLEKITAHEAKIGRGKLKIFFGACPGVGKTYDMLLDAKMQLDEGVDVVAGIIETHGRDATAKLSDFIPKIPAKEVEYRNIKIRELDLDAVLMRKPAIVLIDELAHTNAPNLRHPKRWNDVEEILAAGIDVYATLNVQHLESLNDIVESITGVRVKETIPDSVFDNANDIVLIDINADELLSRLKKGKVYINQETRANAADNFFKKENIIALRELALRRTAQRVDAQMEDYVVREGIREIGGTAKKIMVCIGPDVLSSKLVRSAKRMANSLKVPWIAIYVENSRHSKLNEKAKLVIESYFRMAKRNGAEIVTLYGENAAEEILSYARSKGVDKIIVGKSHKSRFRDLIQGSLAEKIVRKSGTIDVYIITPDLEVKEEQESVGTKFKILNLGNYGGAILLVTICTVFGKIFDNFFEATDQIMIYLIGAVLVAAKFGRSSSVLFSLLSVSAFNFFFVEPYYTFDVANGTYWLTFLVMLITSLFISNQAAQLSRQASISRKREKDTKKFYDLTKELVSIRGHEKIAEIAASHIAEIFDVKVSIWIGKSDNSNQQNLELIAGKFVYEIGDEKEKAVANWCFKNAQMAGIQTDTMPSSKGLYLPLMVLDKVIGVIGVYPKTSQKKFTTNEKSSLEVFANLISSSLERANIAQIAEATKVKAETEKLRNVLLSSISHDLRTPLSSIVGASETIFGNFEKLEKNSIINLAKSINNEAARLVKIIKNVLDITRIESGNLKLNKQPYYIEEIIGSAINRNKEALQNHQIKVSCQKDLPMVLVDGVLIEQLISNLLENAAKYTPNNSLINISVKKEDKNLTVEIEDNGSGISPNKPEQRDGYGLGLIICHAIAKEHGSSLNISNSNLGGVKFSFALQDLISTTEVQYGK